MTTYPTTEREAIGVFDDLPAVNFGNLPPLPEGYVVVWHEGSECYFWTVRGSDIEGGETWDKYRCRREALAHAGRRSDQGDKSNG